jgi:hypothetical protein
MGDVRVLLCLMLCGACTFETSVTPGAGDDTDGPVDADGDAVLDADDNCPSVANTDQRDHDEDLRGDACDLCPHVADADGDGDGDQIGDACDPRIGADSLVVFDGFYDDSAALGWVKAAGTWSLAGGKLRQTMTNTWAFIGPAAPIGRIYADYAFTPLTVGPAFTIQTPNGPATIQPSVGNFGGVVQQSRNYGCAITRDPGNRVTAWANVNGNNNNSPKNWGGDLVATQTYRIVENMATQNRCDFWQGTAVTDTDSENLGATDGTFTFSVAASTVEIDYVFIVAIGS